MFTLNCKGRLLTINKPVVMGILNINPDSFFSHSRFTRHEDILSAAAKMIKEGAAILDIGGQSTRPGSQRVPAAEELQRVIPAIELIHKNFPDTIISIDTYYSLVAKAAVTAGASIINDISAGTIDADLLDTVALLQVPYILMHIQGTPETMQQKPVYENVVREVLDFFIKKTEILRAKGIKDIIIDPGFGFGKTTGQNFQLIEDLSVFKILCLPILLGVSRKGSIYKTLETDAENALNGTTVLNTIGLLNGTHILRVHDVKEAAEAIKLVSYFI
ncbi:MAG: dihydropteroate synthase [Niabella sp.]